jgi:galactose mutarotase-like enzyme
LAAAVTSYESSDGRGLKLRLMDWGATWLSCQVPRQNGASPHGLREVLLGHAQPLDHWSARK